MVGQACAAHRSLPLATPGEHVGKRSRCACEVEGFDKEAGVACLASRARSDEAPELLLNRAIAPGGLTLKRPEGSTVATSFDHALDGVRTDGTDQFILQVGNAHEEPQRLQRCRCRNRAEPGTSQTAADHVELSRVIQPCQAAPASCGSVLLKVHPDLGGTAHLNHRDPVRSEVIAAPLGKGFDRDTIAEPFDQQDRGTPRSR